MKRVHWLHFSVLRIITVLVESLTVNNRTTWCILIPNSHQLWLIQGLKEQQLGNTTFLPGKLQVRKGLAMQSNSFLKVIPTGSQWTRVSTPNPAGLVPGLLLFSIFQTCVGTVDCQSDPWALNKVQRKGCLHTQRWAWTAAWVSSSLFFLHSLPNEGQWEKRWKVKKPFLQPLGKESDKGVHEKAPGNSNQFLLILVALHFLLCITSHLPL